MLYGQYGTLNIKKNIFSIVSADGAGALFFFLFLTNFVDGTSAYLFYFYFNFLFKQANEYEDQGIKLVWPYTSCYQNKN